MLALISIGDDISYLGVIPIGAVFQAE